MMKKSGKSRKCLYETDKIEIIGNNHKVPIIYWWELSDKWKEEYDWMDEDDHCCARFFSYRGWIYYLGDFVICGENVVDDKCPIKFDGVSSDTYFSGTLVKEKEDDSDFIKVYSYFCK